MSEFMLFYKSKNMYTVPKVVINYFNHQKENNFLRNTIKIKKAHYILKNLIFLHRVQKDVLITL